MIGYFFLLAIIIITTVLVWMYLFNIYEIKVISNPAIIKLPQNKTEVLVIPLNSFGKEVLFRKVKAQFFVLNGKELIEKFILSQDSSRVSIKTKNLPGNIELLVKTDKGLFSTKVEIPVIGQ